MPKKPKATMAVTPVMVNAGVHAGRIVLEQYSEFDSELVSDDLLTSAVTEILTAAMAVAPPLPPDPSAPTSSGE